MERALECKDVYGNFKFLRTHKRDLDAIEMSDNNSDVFISCFCQQSEVHFKL